MILYNGRTGGLGRHMENALKAANVPFAALTARLEDPPGLKKELEFLKVPDKTVTLVQLAAMVPMTECEEDPDGAVKTNVKDTLASIAVFYQWAQRYKLTPRVFYVSTSQVYGNAGNKPILETTSTNPQSVYAQTKKRAEEQLLAFGSSRPDLGILIGRLFELVGANQPANLLLPSLIRRAREKNFTPIAGLRHVRDYLDARDACRIIVELCQLDWDSPAFPEDRLINICSGKPVTIREMFLIVLELSGVPWREAESQLAAAPKYRDDVPVIVGDPGRLRALLKQEPQKITLQQTIEDATRL